MVSNVKSHCHSDPLPLGFRTRQATIPPRTIDSKDVFSSPYFDANLSLNQIQWFQQQTAFMWVMWVNSALKRGVQTSCQLLPPSTSTCPTVLNKKGHCEIDWRSIHHDSSNAVSQCHGVAPPFSSMESWMSIGDSNSPR